MPPIQTASVLAALSLAATALATAGPPDAGENSSSGEALFRSYCVSCHGADGRGDGPLADALRIRPADLTRLARRGGGEFKADKVRRMIDRRAALSRAHGDSDMPVWGDAFARATEGYSEKAVRARIDALVAHLESIQVK